MDRPLKFFLSISVGFCLFFIFLLVVTPTEDSHRPVDQSNKNSPDSLFVKADKRVSETLVTLFKLYPKFPENSFVKFRIENSKGKNMHVWGKITELESDHVSTTVLEKFDPDNALPESIDLSIDQLEDWIVEMGDGSVRGGFTTQALLIREKQQEPNNMASLDSQLQLFLDPIE